MDKRELMKRRTYISERLPEIMLERHRLKQEAQNLKAENAASDADKSKAARSRLTYIKVRMGELKTDHASLTEERLGIAAGLKALKTKAGPA
jgi:hypothetical protein